MFTWKPLAACRRLEPRKHSRTLALTHPGILSSPLSDRVDCFNHDRFRGYDTVHFRSGLLPSCLRFAVYVTGHHARLGTRLSARLCRGRHLRRLTSIRLQGATLTDPDLRLSPHPARATARRLPPSVERRAHPGELLRSSSITEPSLLLRGSRPLSGASVLRLLSDSAGAHQSGSVDPPKTAYVSLAAVEERAQAL